MSILHKKKITIEDFKKNMFSHPIVGLTAYSKNMAEIIDHYVDFILVGDSLGITLYGMKNTRSVTLEMMNHVVWYDTTAQAYAIQAATNAPAQVIPLNQAVFTFLNAPS